MFHMFALWTWHDRKIPENGVANRHDVPMARLKIAIDFAMFSMPFNSTRAVGIVEKKPPAMLNTITDKQWYHIAEFH